MSQKGQTITLEELVTIAGMVEAGQTGREIAEALERLIATVRK